ncbi:MAG: hypothetical protein HYY16_19120 [Planctomycetes bacterium]|nr:hypothetical protein [Planctomycetota bacterium]
MLMSTAMSSPAMGDVNGTSGREVLVPTSTGLRAYDKDGRFLFAHATQNSAGSPAPIQANTCPTLKTDTISLDALWADLAGEDAPTAYRAVWTLIGAGEKAVPLLRACLLPTTDENRIRRFILDLDHDDIQVRDQAAAELQKLGPTVAPALHRALEQSPSAEVHELAKAILATFDRPPFSRAVQVLEQIGTKEARKALKALGTPDAQAALKRLGQ